MTFMFSTGLFMSYLYAVFPYFVSGSSEFCVLVSLNLSSACVFINRFCGFSRIRSGTIYL